MYQGAINPCIAALDLATMACMAASGDWEKPCDYSESEPLVVIRFTWLSERVRLHISVLSASDLAHPCRKRLLMGLRGRRVELREVPIRTGKDAYADIVMALLPAPEATCAEDVEVELFRRLPLDRWTWRDYLMWPWRRPHEHVMWTCRVHPAHVWPMTPVVGGVAPLPLVRYALHDGWRFRVSCKTSDACPGAGASMRVLVGTMLWPAFVILASMVQIHGAPPGTMPAEIKLLEDVHQTSLIDDALSLPDVESALVDARRRDLVARGPFRREGDGFRELAEAVWAPARVARRVGGKPPRTPSRGDIIVCSLGVPE